ncbi:MAG: proline--tRNA ligase [Anaerolineae bacterium]|jgi:prolyl-tRNA synthetase|nr:proline--tRNA ligase [Chloroflexota bacterium]
MRISTLFGQRLRQAPSDAGPTALQLALRVGLMRRTSQGAPALLPTGWRAIRRLQAIIRQELDALDGQELLLPLPKAVVSGLSGAAWPMLSDVAGGELARGSGTVEEAADLARQEIHSYRQLPALVYQFQTSFPHDPQGRPGLLGNQEQLMHEVFTFDQDAAGMARSCSRVSTAWQRVWERCGLSVRTVEATLGNVPAQAFMVSSPMGDDELVHCPACGYAATAVSARFRRSPSVAEQAQALALVETPGANTIEALARYLGISTDRTLKAVMYQDVDTGRLVFVAIRGDLAVNEAKLAHLLGGALLQVAPPEALQAAGAVGGYASPVGLRETLIVVDESVQDGVGLVGGANREGYHYWNVVLGRDYVADLVGDVALAREGDPCPHCGGSLHTERAVQLGQGAQLGTSRSETAGAQFLDESGRARHPYMGRYTMGLLRLFACIIDAHHDESGILWPQEVAPYQVHLVSLAHPGTPEEQRAEELYAALCEAGMQVLYDDRSERAGVKFAEADLLGAPGRLTISSRSLAQGGVEFKRRCEGQSQLVPLAPLSAILDLIGVGRPL